MPVADEATATALILAHFKTAWDAQGGTVPAVLYENTDQDPPKDGSPYVKTLIRHAIAPQVTFSEPGSQRFRSTGLAMFEVYSRLGVGVTADANYAKVIRDAFRGSVAGVSGVRFRNARSLEQGRSGNMYLTNVLVDFEYDTIG